MSENPFEEKSASSAGKNKYWAESKNPIAGLKSMDIGRALTQLRWINFILGIATVIVNIFGIIGVIMSFNIGIILINCFCILFAGILCLYELQMKKLGNKLRRLYGFLYTYIGRSSFLFFLGTLLLSCNDWFSNIFGGIMTVVALYNLLILFIHPAFKNGNRKITDDPTQSYTAGESEITNIMRNNPALAQKMLVGASKLAT